jgi:hypothetical protein
MNGRMRVRTTRSTNHSIVGALAVFAQLPEQPMPLGHEPILQAFHSIEKELRCPRVVPAPLQRLDGGVLLADVPFGALNEALGLSKPQHKGGSVHFSVYQPNCRQGRSSARGTKLALGWTPGLTEPPNRSSYPPSWEVHAFDCRDWCQMLQFVVLEGGVDAEGADPSRRLLPPSLGIRPCCP